MFKVYLQAVIEGLFESNADGQLLLLFKFRKNKHCLASYAHRCVLRSISTTKKDFSVSWTWYVWCLKNQEASFTQTCYVARH